MRCSTLIRLLVLFVFAHFACSILGFTIPEQLLSQPSDDATTKIGTLQSKLAMRIAMHKSLMTEYIGVLSVTINKLSSTFDDSTLALTDFKHQLPNLKQADMPQFLSNLFSYLKVSGGKLKRDVAVGLKSLEEVPTLMSKETNNMDLFLVDILEEMNALEKEILAGKVQAKPKLDAIKNLEHLSANTKAEEKTLLEKVFKDYIATQRKCHTSYLNIPANHPPNQPTRCRYTTTFNTTLMYANDLCDYTCESIAQVVFAVSPSLNKDAAFEYEEVSMNCTTSAHGRAKGSLGEWGSGQDLFAIWFD